MRDELANFRELHGIGPATEGELHEAGVRTWASLVAVLDALGRVRGVAGDALHALRQQARDRASEAATASDAGRVADGARSDAGHVDRGGTDASAPVVQGPDPDDGPVTNHRVTLDAGKVVGGRTRAIDLALSTADFAGPEPFTYDARLVGRRYGAPDADWTTLGQRAGHGQPPDGLPLHFTEVDLSPGLHRLRVDVTLTLETPTHTAPLLTVT
jgi:hypothetical protein